MTVHSHQKKRRRDSQMKFKALGDHEEFLERITKTLYYVDLPRTERFSLPLSELAVELFSEVKSGKSLERLSLEDASEISRNACISPCSLVLALLYLEQLKTSNPDYVDRVTSSDLFVISLMVASKFLNDSGEEDDVLNSEWAVSAGLSLSHLNKLEMDFLNAIFSQRNRCRFALREGKRRGWFSYTELDALLNQVNALLLAQTLFTDWKIFINDEAFWEKLRLTESRLALREGKRRGWFSYTELDALLNQVNALLLAQTLFTVSAVCLASYAAGVLTVIGSTMVASQVLYIPPSQQHQQHPSNSLRTELTLDSQNLSPAWGEEGLSADIEREYLTDLWLETHLYNRTLDDCLADHLDPDTCNKFIFKETSHHQPTDNISSYYKNFFAPITFNLINFPRLWKAPTYIFSE